MNLTKKELINIGIGSALVLTGLGIASILILLNQDSYLFTAIVIGNIFIAVATYVFMAFGLNRYIAGKRFSPLEAEKGNRITQIISVGTAILVLFLIPFGKMMMEESIVVWAVILSCIFVIVGATLCITGWISWNQEVINKRQIIRTNDN